MLKYSSFIIVPYTIEKNYYRNYRYLRLLSILLHQVINYRDAAIYRCMVTPLECCVLIDLNQ